MFAESYLKNAAQIIREFKGEEPFASFLKKYFAANKKFGSRDRKQIAHLCYCYFRLGKSLKEVDVPERILVGLYLCSQAAQPVLSHFKPEWNETIAEGIDTKLKIVQKSWSFEIADIFPFSDHLSTTIDHFSFASSFLIQPDTYLRIRPGKEEPVKNKLRRAEVPFSEISPYCLSVPPSTKLENYVDINKDAVVQDINSQKVINPLIEYIKDKSRPLRSWDCCAASGGKSILLKDSFQNIQLTVSDIRESIIVNLRKRFKEAGISDYQSFVADISSPQFRHDQKYDLVICDAPCSGSGTWGRTPEQLYFFEQEKISYYSALQQKIALNACRYLKKGGIFLYITCSVFKEENEKVVEVIQKNCPLHSPEIQYFAGYQNKADTLFTAMFIKKDYLFG